MASRRELGGNALDGVRHNGTRASNRGVKRPMGADRFGPAETPGTAAARRLDGEALIKHGELGEARSEPDVLSP